MFNFFKKHKAQVEPEQVLSVSDRVLNIFSRIEGLDDIKEMMLLSLGDNNLAVRFCSGICFTVYCWQLFVCLSACAPCASTCAFTPTLAHILLWHTFTLTALLPPHCACALCTHCKPP